MTRQTQKFTKGFRREVVRLSRESGRTVREMAVDLGVGMSLFSKWRYVRDSMADDVPHMDASFHGRRFCQK